MKLQSVKLTALHSFSPQDCRIINLICGDKSTINCFNPLLFSNR
ncbi:hypothetical protein C9I91_15225 [Photobacterium jeanii]|nr:hypothetical protein C9I91_15225 [Photobacterium jeanii]